MPDAVVDLICVITVTVYLAILTTKGLCVEVLFALPVKSFIEAVADNFNAPRLKVFCIQPVHNKFISFVRNIGDGFELEPAPVRSLRISRRIRAQQL
ncbi:hypothetical protein PoB_004334000 [Plakobranchus ocellatus]|uniref:Secreted protein n=1 Tax=Plakobranchus ocellatus TaxID=259542 RepID=A0AAV4BBC4_9GAST|nr:hypothetical protein PoB_004334000 [Plakobranchus ocellatus]